MPGKFTYLLVDLLCIAFPLVFSFLPQIKFYRRWRFFVLPCLITAVFFLVWDVLFTRAGIWGFNPAYVTGIYFFGLPLEEYLFFICIPYACVFTYYSVVKLLGLPAFHKSAIYLSWFFIIFLVIAGLSQLARLYTSITFISLSFFLLFVLYKKVSFLPSFYVAFAIILIPFFVANGILTGTGPDAPVVFYNNHYNSGIRMLTIPFEDTFYGMLLMLMNVTGFEFLLHKSREQGGIEGISVAK
jgi:lycopene cyclase domain-containing protein